MQNCLKCGTKTQVYDSRLTDDGSLRRKRKCPQCGARHATIEMLDETTIPFARPRQPSPPKPQPKKKPEVKGKPQPKIQGGSKKPARLMTDDDYEEDYTYTADEMEFVRGVFGNSGGRE